MSDADAIQEEKDRAADAKRRRRLYEEEIKFIETFRGFGKRIEFFDRNSIAAITGKIICGIYDGDDDKDIIFARETRARLFNRYLKAAKKEGTDHA